MAGHVKTWRVESHQVQVCWVNLSPVALTGEELRKRIVSAAALHGWGLRGLRDRLEDYGANRHMAERMIAGKVPRTRANLDALAAVLEVPCEWFEDEDWRPLIRVNEGVDPAMLDQAVEGLRTELLARLAQQSGSQEGQRKLPEPGSTGEGVTGG